MKKRSNETFLQVEIGFTVQILIPNVDKGHLNVCSILAAVVTKVRNKKKIFIGFF